MAHKWTLASGSNSSDRLADHPLAAVHLSDGTLVFVYWDPGSSIVRLAYSSDHTATSDIATLATGLGNPFAAPTAGDFALARDSLDNLFVVGRNGTNDYQLTVKAFTKGAGLSWTAQTHVSGSPSGTDPLALPSVVWCSTGGGTNSKGHLLVLHTSNGNKRYTICDAGVPLAGSGTLLTANSTPGFLNAPTIPGAVAEMDIAPDGFGATSGLAAAAHTGLAYAVGRWGVNSSGALSTNTNITASGSMTSATRLRLVRFASDKWGLFVNSSGNKVAAARYSSTALLTAAAAWGTVTDMPTPGAGNSWDVFADPVVADKVWLVAWSTAAATTALRLGVALGSGVTWDSTATTADTSVGTGTNSTLRAVRHPVGVYVDWQTHNVNGSTRALLGDYSQFNSTPLAPTLNGPAAGSSQDLAAGYTFTWTFNDNDPGQVQSAFAFRRKIGAGAYEYYDDAAGTWGASAVWNSSSTEAVTFPSGKWTNGNTYSWSAATKDNAGASNSEGPFASDITVVASTGATVTVTDPTGTISDTTRPTVEGTISDPESDPIQTVRAKIFTAAQYGAGGFDPSTSTAVFDSGEIAGSGTSFSVPPTVDLENGTTFRAYVQVKTNGQYSAWDFEGFTLSLTPPSAPTLTAAADNTNARVTLTVTGTHATADFAATTFLVEYSDDSGATWNTVRGAAALAGSGTPGPTTQTVYDYESTPSAARSYRAFTIADV